MDYRFCPKCGYRLSKKTDSDGFQRLYCSACKFVFYQNSAPTATAIINNGSRVLLTKRAVDPYKDYWDLPGGFLEQGEHPINGVKREIKEELGVRIKVLEMIGIFMDEYPYANGKLNTLNIFYLARIIRGIPKPDSDVKEVRWFDLNDLPSKTAFKSGRRALRAYIKLKNEK